MNEMHVQDNTEYTALLKRVGQVARLMESRLDAALAGHGLSLAKLSVLWHLVQAGEPLPLGQLAERQSCVKSNITQLVDRLEAEGLVRRVPDPEDRRSVRAEITQEGRRRYEAGMQAQAEVERELFRGLSLEERVALARVLERLGGGQGEP
jgi:DNA-binding MarR family transcriptional regulator